MLRFLANENFPGDAVKALTRIGYDVAWILKDAPGSSDEEVLKRAMLSINIFKLKRVNIINLCCAGFIISELGAGRSILKKFARTILRSSAYHEWAIMERTLENIYNCPFALFMYFIYS